MKIALDAHGGDNAPLEIIEGAKLAAAEGINVIAVGRADEINSLISDSHIEVVDTREIIEMDDDPAISVRKKQNSSLVVANELVRDGQADAVVSAGNTGAAMAASLLKIGRLKGVQRPAIATPLPLVERSPVILIDAGANSDCQPAWLVQFAKMGALLSKHRYGIKIPKVGLLSIGEEDKKGNELAKATHVLLKDAANNVMEFAGNAEGRDILEGNFDVIVTDGFTGNVTLKTLEGSMKFFLKTITNGLGRSGERGQKVLTDLFDLLKSDLEKLDPESTGGAILIGLKAVSIISHGSSRRKAIKNALITAVDLVESGIVDNVAQAMRSQ